MKLTCDFCGAPMNSPGHKERHMAECEVPRQCFTAMSDALRQWQWAEQHLDAGELKAARRSRDGALTALRNRRNAAK